MPDEPLISALSRANSATSPGGFYTYLYVPHYKSSYTVQGSIAKHSGRIRFKGRYTKCRECAGAEPSLALERGFQLPQVRCCGFCRRRDHLSAPIKQSLQKAGQLAWHALEASVFFPVPGSQGVFETCSARLQTRMCI